MVKGLDGKRIVLGVTGGIAAYKSADLTSKLVQLGADVHVLLTQGAREFIQPMTFQALTRNPVYTSVFDGWVNESAGHVTLAATADVVVVAPATANTIAKIAQGVTDDMLGAVLLATPAPVLIAPAMEHHMWHHSATQENLAKLIQRGVHTVDPESGYLASGVLGDGRLAGIDSIITRIRRLVGAKGSLQKRKIVITAGGTHEAIDPVRFIGNSSSGTMGIALAYAALDRGADVVLIVGPTVTNVPSGIRVVCTVSALDMQDAVEREVQDADALIMAAAVADFRPATAAEQKVKKADGQDSWQLPLVKNPDIIAGIHCEGLVKVGFAAETDDLIANARFKLVRKGLDMIVANDAVATIGSVNSQATILMPNVSTPEALPQMSKVALASEIIDRLQAMLSPLDDQW